MFNLNGMKGLIVGLAAIEDVGAMAAFLASPSARHITGQVIYVDSGFNIRG